MKQKLFLSFGILLFTGVLYFNMHQLEQTADLNTSSIVLVETAAFANTSGGGSSSGPLL